MQKDSYIGGLIAKARQYHKTIVLPEGEDERVLKAAHLIREEKVAELVSEGYTRFISGGALGADSDFAEIVIDLRKSAYPDITLEVAAPLPQSKFEMVRRR